MTDDLPSVKGGRALRALARDGWTVHRITGHIFLRHPSKPGVVAVPNHPSRTIKPGTLRSILKQAGLTVEEFRALL